MGESRHRSRPTRRVARGRLEAAPRTPRKRFRSQRSVPIMKRESRQSIAVRTTGTDPTIDVEKLQGMVAR